MELLFTICAVTGAISIVGGFLLTIYAVHCYNKSNKDHQVFLRNMEGEIFPFEESSIYHN